MQNQEGKKMTMDLAKFYFVPRTPLDMCYEKCLANLKKKKSLSLYAYDATDANILFEMNLNLMPRMHE